MPFRLAEFDHPEQLVAAAKALRGEGYERLDALTPYAIPELTEVLALPKSRAPQWIFGAGVSGAAGGALLQWFCNAYDYPLNVGGRPMSSLPAWVPIVFEMTVLAAALAAFVAVIVGGGMPRLVDPIDVVSLRARSTLDRYLLAIDVADPKFVPDACTALLESCGALRVVDPEPVR